MPPLDQKCCLLLNFTGNSYHWGCYCTSVEVYQSLVERGFYVTYRTVAETHRPLPEVPEDLTGFQSVDQANRFLKANPILSQRLQEADRIVVNGEGTLHRNKIGPWTLLYLMYFAKKFLKKPVHLINGSYYPTGSTAASVGADTLYGGVLRNLDVVASRETLSTAVMQRLAVPAVQSFDCLPRFVHRHGLERADAPDGPIVLAGGVALTEPDAHALAAGVKPLIHAGRPALFLHGAKQAPASEEKWAFERMRRLLPHLTLVEASSVRTWLETIGTAALMVSGRFHHTLAAASLRTPVVCLPSNTPKLEAVCAMLGLAPPIAPDEGTSLADTIRNRAEAALEERGPTVSDATWAHIQTLAERNFTGLDGQE